MKVENGIEIRNPDSVNVHSYSSQSSTLDSQLLSFHRLNYQSTIIQKRILTDNVYEFAIDNEQVANRALPGQFLHIKCSNENILRRPISISNVIGDKVFFIIETRGEGTKYLCEKSIGETLDLIGPLGNAFSIPKGDVLLVGGGIGVAPLFFVAQSLSGRATAIFGFRDKSRVILSDLIDNSARDELLVITEDGSFEQGGIALCGTVTEHLEKKLMESRFSTVISCGPSPMMASVAKLCHSHGVSCQVSLEERMACGVGACYVCACKTKGDSGESMSRVCVDGPVFDARRVVFGENHG